MYILNSILIFLLILIQIKWSFCFSKNFLFNQNERKFPTFLIDFELASVLCQHSNNPKDLHLHDISILCNKHQECLQSLFGQDDESFPHCRHLQCRGGTRKEVDCSGKGACIFDGFTTRCFCNEGYYGLNCEYFGNKNEEKEAFDEFGLEFGKVVLNNKYPNERKNWLKMKEIINEAKEANKKQKEFGLLIGKGRMEMVEGGGHETSTKATSKSKATETTELPNFEATSASSSEANTRRYNTEASSILNLEATSASSFETSTRGYNTEASPLSTLEANFGATSVKNSQANTRTYTEASLEASSASNTEASKLAIFEAISASNSETSPKVYNTEASSILNPETTSASNSILYTESYTEVTSLLTSASNTEATSIKNSETSLILNLEAITKAGRETASSSKIKATSLETAETTFSNFEPKSEANTEATIYLNTQINPGEHSTKASTVKESKSNKPNNEAILVDNEANFKPKIEAEATSASTPNNGENLLAETEAASLSTIPTGIEETSPRTEYASTKKFSTNEANLSKQMKQHFLTSEAPITETPNYASSLPSTFKINSEITLLQGDHLKTTKIGRSHLKMWQK